MSDQILSAYARLSTHEFMLEILYANLFLQMTTEQEQEFCDEVLSKSQMAWMSPDAAQSSDDLTDIQLAHQSSEMTQHFLIKARKRADGIRG